MSWTNIPNGNLAIGAPIRSIDQLALRDNPIAIAEGATGAPRVRAEALNGGQSGTAPIYAARAWVNFDGTTATPSTIAASGNVSSVTRNATGEHTINFTTAMPDTNYVTLGSTVSQSNQSSSTTVIGHSGQSTKTTTEVQIGVRTLAGSLINVNQINVTIFR